MTYKDLSRSDIRALTRILGHVPPPFIPKDGSVYTSYRQHTAAEIDRLRHGRTRDLSAGIFSTAINRGVSVVVNAMGIQNEKGDVEFGKKLCNLHAPLNRNLINSLFDMVRHELDKGIPSFIEGLESAGCHLNEDQLEALVPIKQVNQMWMTKSHLMDLADRGVTLSKHWAPQSDGCTACILGRIGGDKDVCYALRVGMAARYRELRMSEERSARVWWVSGWLQHFENGTRVIEDAHKVGMELKQLARKGRGGGSSLAPSTIISPRYTPVRTWATAEPANPTLPALVGATSPVPVKTPSVRSHTVSRISHRSSSYSRHSGSTSPSSEYPDEVEQSQVHLADSTQIPTSVSHKIPSNYSASLYSRGTNEGGNTPKGSQQFVDPATKSATTSTIKHRTVRDSWIPQSQIGESPDESLTVHPISRSSTARSQRSDPFDLEGLGGPLPNLFSNLNLVSELIVDGSYLRGAEVPRPLRVSSTQSHHSQTASIHESAEAQPDHFARGEIAGSAPSVRSRHTSRGWLQTAPQISDQHSSQANNVGCPSVDGSQVSGQTAREAVPRSGGSFHTAGPSSRAASAEINYDYETHHNNPYNGRYNDIDQCSVSSDGSGPFGLAKAANRAQQLNSNVKTALYPHLVAKDMARKKANMSSTHSPPKSNKAGKSKAKSKNAGLKEILYPFAPKKSAGTSKTGENIYKHQPLVEKRKLTRESNWDDFTHAYSPRASINGQQEG